MLMTDINYGPQHEHVVALLERAKALTPGEIDALYEARDASREAAREAARGAAWYASMEAARHAAWYASVEASRHAARDSAWFAAWNATRDAARALIARDLITADQYRILLQPWASVCGWPHPDDAARYGGGEKES